MREQDITVTASVALRVEQCWSCRKFWAYEKAEASPGCPYCTKIYWRNAQDHGAKLQLRISALRGVITRLGGKRGRR